MKVFESDGGMNEEVETSYFLRISEHRLGEQKRERNGKQRMGTKVVVNSHVSPRWS